MGWIDMYLQYTKKQESPEMFHFWCAVSAIASILERKCWLHRGYYTLFPNHYIVLVSESAWTRKTTAADMAIDIVRATGKVEIIEDEFTKQSFYNAVATVRERKQLEGNSVTVYAEELMVCLGKEAVGSGLIAMLTKAYKCGAIEYRTIARGVERTDDVCVNFLGCTTYDWMSAVLPGETVEGGFAGRVIFVVEEQRKHKDHWPKLPNTDILMRNKLIVELDAMSRVRGEYTISAEAKEVHREYYNTLDEPEDPRLRGFFGRKGDHVIKLAMVLCVSDTRALNIEERHMVRAIDILNKTEKKMPLAFRGVSLAKEGANIDRLKSLLIKEVLLNAKIQF